MPFTSSLHKVAFINVKFHLPGEFPYRVARGITPMFSGKQLDVMQNLNFLIHYVVQYLS